MIADFQEREGDAFHESWGRFKLLLAQCLHPEYTLVSQVQSFYDGLTRLSQAIVDNAYGGAIRERWHSMYLTSMRCLNRIPSRETLEVIEEE